MKKYFFLTTAIVISCIISRAEIITGTCGADGDNVTWSLNTADSTLTISGRGAMGFPSNTAPWIGKYRSTIRRVAIEDGVTSIAAYAFQDCWNIDSISYTNSITSIGVCAFNGCGSVRYHFVPSSVTYIGDGAFSKGNILSIIVDALNPVYDSRDNCNAIIETASNRLIAGCGNTIIPNSVTSIGTMAFLSCENLTSIRIPNSVVSLGENSFGNCIRLQSITIPSSVTSIGAGSLYTCNELQEIIVEGENPIYDSRDNCNAIIMTSTNTLIAGCMATTIPSSVKTIGSHAFHGCSMTEFTIPQNVKFIESFAFYGCNQLNSLICNAVVPPILREFVFYNVNKFIPLYVQYTSIEAYQHTDGWHEFTNIQAISGTEPIVIISNYCGADGDGTNLSLVLTSDSILTISGSGAMAETFTLEAIYREYVKSAVIKDGVTSIAGYTFSGCSNLTSVSIASSVVSIGTSAFADCSSLLSITIPSNVTDIGMYAFACPNLQNITCEAVTPPAIAENTFMSVNHSIPIYVPSGADDAYKNTEDWSKFTNIQAVCLIASGNCGLNLTWKLSCDSVLTISGRGAMKNYGTYQYPWNEYIGSIRQLILNDGITTIENGAFNLCANLESVTIPNSVYAIFDIAFCSCTSLKSVMIGRGVNYISDIQAFWDCPALTEINIDENNPAYCSIDGVLFTKDVTQLIQYPQGKRDSAYIIPSTVQRLCFCSLSGNYLHSIAIPNSVTDIEERAIADCWELSSIELPENLKTLGSEAFRNCAKLTSVNIGSKVISIGRSPFLGCQDLNDINIAKDNPKYCSINGVLFNKGATTLLEYPSGRKGAYSIPNNVDTIADYAIWHCYNLTAVTIPQNLVYIGMYGFRTCALTYITSKAISPPSLGGEAFYDTDKSIPLYVPEESIELYRKAYGWNEFSNIQAINIIAEGTCGAEGDGSNLTWELSRDSVLTISGRGAMAERSQDNPIWESYREQIRYVKISDGVSKIAAFAFYGCYNLTGIEIPNSVTFIGEGAFMYCYVLKDLTLPNALTSIETQVLCECKSITNIDLPRTITGIGDQAFALCENLQSIVIPAGVTSIGSAAFAGTNLNKIIVESANTTYDSRDNCNAIIETATNTLIAGCKNTIIPNTITAIAPYSLGFTHGLKKLSFPSSVTDFGEGIFQGCEDLVKVTIMSSSAQFGDGVFNGCSSLAEIVCYAIVPPYAGPNTFLDVNKSAIIYVPDESVEAYKRADGWSEFANILAIEPPTVSVFGQDVIINDSTGIETGEPVDILGDSTLLYDPEENTLTFNSLDLEVGDSVSTAITYSGTEPLTIVLCDTSTILADTVISSSSDIIITGDGMLIAEGTVPIVGAATATITFDSVNMYVRSLPTPASVRRRIKGIVALDENGGPALSGFSSADFNKTNVTPPEAEYGEVEEEQSGSSSVINALYVLNADGTKTVLSEFTLTAVADAIASVEQPKNIPVAKKIIRDGQLFILRDGKTYTVQGLVVR